MTHELKLETLKKYFGYPSFREGQEELINSVLAGKDCLAVMPTGAGKSICYQLPALLSEGITLVVSPLISLMKDQVGALTQMGIRAAYLNSSLTERQARMALDNARLGHYRIIYIAPERLESESFLDFARNADIAMITVDEAHCISRWGQDFRPSYLGIRNFIDSLPKRPVISAFTATATAAVRDDIIDRLRLLDPYILVSGFDRKNLFFEVRQPKKKALELLDFLSGRNDESGIIYCSTRKTVEQVGGLLADRGYGVRCYHAGLPDQERRDNQDDFQYDRAKIMVATNAFGMGIDKSNVRFVVHYNMPKDLESYYQEAGRAGRDGEPAHCLLMYSGQDVRTAIFLIEHSRDAVYEDKESERLIKEQEHKRLRDMTFYCRTGDCLRGYILKYFGEKPESQCGNCANCLDSFELADVTVTAQKILSCIKRMGERFGAKIVIDVLRGGKNERIARLGLDKLSTYGICEESEKSLKDVIDHLVLRELLNIGGGEYPVLTLGEGAGDVLRGEVTVEMKLPRVSEKSVRERRREATQKPGRPMDRELFGRLAAIRIELATKQGVPAYVVFPDSALADMCLKLPANEEEFLEVSGVGQVKLERYGKEFLKAISEYEGPPEDSAPDLVDNGLTGLDFAGEIAVSDEAVTVSIVADRINTALIQRGVKKTTGAKINALLIEDGYIQADGGFKTATGKGEALGIETVEREIRGKPCKLCLFSKDAQRFVIDTVISSILDGE